ncbi:hypothetical protein HC251_15530 [Iamia sp. SCSIO 61187]|uniref:hypothetical protein n=1 Tax=Iamia sp. SCSIO 61187 TaxID=2722752 RepID=UPI001C62E10D|nr:hypothetical protein [Iamia sp. SCSIO 61187]QYG93695.1 hypothetical protein HC251_15530 [Iamia sp. SCSIO 61187]
MPERPPTTHRVVTGDDGRPVLVKRATDPAAAARLTGEATILRALAHPGAVQVVAHHRGPTGTELHLAWVGPHSLATVAGLPPPAAADIVAQVATTVADLHRAGIVHGRITADHVLLAADGRAVLTGFADASRSGAVDPAVDVAALGALLTSLVVPSDGGPVIPDRRRAHAGDDGRRATLLTLADRAQADDPAARPAAGELAASIRDAVGPPTRSRRARPPREHESRARRVALPRPGRRTLSGVALGAIVAATAAAAAWIAPSSADPGPDRAVPTTTAPPPTDPPRSTTTLDVRPAPTTTAPAPTAPDTTTTTAPGCAPAGGAVTADVDGDGCPEAVVVEGERVTVEGTTWRAGEPGDLAVVADWDCDGRATVATLRTRTGEVFVFDRWVEPAEALTVSAVSQVAGATGLRAADPDGDGCAVLVADRGDQEPIVVDVAA